MSDAFSNGGDGGTAGTHDWLTPPDLLAKLGVFDMDPCASQFQPWRTAAQQFTIEDDGLAREWARRVLRNPPTKAELARAKLVMAIDEGKA